MTELNADPAIESKWNRIYEACDDFVPADVLLENSFLLPETGSALDLACGLGANALLLAENGLDTQAWDISSVALKRLQHRAKHQGLEIITQQLMLRIDSLPANTFDVIVVSRFLQRSLCDAIMASLKTGGLLFYQTYVREKLSTQGPKNPDFLLQRNELLKLFKPLKIVVYRENTLLGNLRCGERDEAFLVGQKC